MKTIEILLLLHLVNGEKENKQRSAGKIADVGPPPIPDNMYVGAWSYDDVLDPATGLKTPIDFLERSMIYPQTEEEKRYYLKTRPLSRIQFMKRPTIAPSYYNPRDEIVNNIKNRTDSNQPMWLDFVSLQSNNFNEHRPKQEPIIAPNGKEVTLDETKFNNMGIYSRNSFAKANNIVRNWTTCDEFKKKSVFHPKDLLNLNWIPFYTWCPQRFDLVMIHKFSIPTKRTVVRFKQEYGPYLSEAVDWNSPKLLLENGEQSLLIAADQRGLFHAIKDQKVSDYVKTHPNVKYPVITLRLKIVDPYIAMMYCGDYFATIMAIDGEEPMTDKLKTEEARILNFTGIGYPVSKNVYAQTNKAKWLAMVKEREEEFSKLQAKNPAINKNNN